MKTLLIATTLFVSATCTYAAPKSSGSGNKSTGSNKSVTTNKSVAFNKTVTTNKIHNTNTGNKSVSVFSGKTNHAKNHTQFVKTFRGHRCFARTYCGWTHRCFFPRFGCYGYYCPSTCCWYYLYAAGDCYMPVDQMQEFPPTPNDTGDTGDNGTPALPEGAEPIN